LSRAKLDGLRLISTAELVASLAVEQRDSLKVKVDGTVLDGHHRIFILRERGIDVDSLPRDIWPKESGKS
jgi:hypothetical protein